MTKVLDINGSIRTVIYTEPDVCANATAVLKDTASVTLSTTVIASGASANITAPDATVENSNASYTDSVVSGGTWVLPDITVTDSDGSTFTQPSVENVVCTLSPDTDLEVNGTPEGTFAAGSTIEVNITDGVNPVTPDAVTVVGDVVTIEVPSGGGNTYYSADNLKTNQTVSYGTGDDGDLEFGRDTDFFTLAVDIATLTGSSNPSAVGNTNRFTDELLGQTYANAIVIDWSTYNGLGCWGFHRTLTANTGTLQQLIDVVEADTAHGYTDWHVPNIRQLFNLVSFGNTNLRLNYSPFNIGLSTNISSGTYRENDSTRCLAITAYSSMGSVVTVASVSNSFTRLTMPCRFFTNAELSL